ncbi:MAG: ABC transporter ATP-binding protein [Candidatus Hodarchaeales archaeon]
MTTIKKNCLLTLEHVNYNVDNSQILSDISVEIDNESITGVIGPSGAGKSTLLYLLNKLISPSSGNIFLDGLNFNEIPTRSLRKKIGLVQQRPYLFPGTVKDNLLYGPKIWKIKYSDKELSTLLERVALEPEYLCKDVDKLSGGERQRVSLARSLANKPRVLLLDEPTSSLDIASEEILETTIKNLAKQGLKVIVVTHSLEQTKRLTDQLLFLKDGQLIENKTTEEFFSVFNESEIKDFFKRGVQKDYPRISRKE